MWTHNVDLFSIYIYIYIYYKLKQWLYLKFASAQRSQRMWTKFVHHVTKLHHPDKKRKWQQSVFSQHNHRIIQKNISQSLLKRERKRVPLALVNIRALAINSKILSLSHTHIHSVVTLCFTHTHTHAFCCDSLLHTHTHWFLSTIL